MQLVREIAAGAWNFSWCLLLQLVLVIAADACYCSWWCLILQLLMPVIAAGGACYCSWWYLLLQLVPVIAAGACYCSWWYLLLQPEPVIATSACCYSWYLLLQLVPVIAVGVCYCSWFVFSTCKILCSSKESCRFAWDDVSLLCLYVVFTTEVTMLNAPTVRLFSSTDPLIRELHCLFHFGINNFTTIGFSILQAIVMIL